MNIETLCVHSPNEDKNAHAYGAMTVPIYQTATFSHPGVGESTGYDYSRQSNPTRTELEDCISAMEGAYDTVATSTGMAACSLVLELFNSGDHIAKEHKLLLIVDNTFLSPYFQNPIKLGADIVIHSGTKYIAGHNDTLAGFVCTANEELSEKIRFMYKTIGPSLSPFDSFLVLRGLKTLAVRMDRIQENALKIANFLKTNKKVTNVYYVGLPEHPGYEINKSQSRGFGGMIAFTTDTAKTARDAFEKIEIIKYAESLGGVESLITFPMIQTHADVPVEVRERLGITDTFLRLSVGIENVDDLIKDLERALE